MLQVMHDHFGHFGIGKTYSLIKRYYYWPKMIKHIETHVESCSLCRREKFQVEKYQLQATEIPEKPFAKVSIVLIVEFPVSHSGNKNILVMADELTGWPVATAIPGKEATAVANAIYKDLVLVHGCPEILLSDNVKEFTNDCLAYVSEESNIEQHFSSPYTPRSNGKTENIYNFLKASIRNLWQEDKEVWDLALPQILFAYKCCPHTSTSKSPYTLVHDRDPVLPIHKLIKVTTLYQGESSLGKSIELVVKMLERMRKDQKRTYEGRKTICQFHIDDLVLLKKLDLKWEPNYRVIGLPTAWTAVFEHMVSGSTRRSNVGDLSKKHSHEDCQLKASNVGKAAKFINHPSILPGVEYTVDKPDSCDNGKLSKGGYNHKKFIKPKQRLDL